MINALAGTAHWGPSYFERIPEAEKQMTPEGSLQMAVERGDLEEVQRLLTTTDPQLRSDILFYFVLNTYLKHSIRYNTYIKSCLSPEHEGRAGFNILVVSDGMF